MTTQTHADKIPIVRFNPNQDGLARWFGPLETEIMEVLWGSTKSLTVKSVHRAINSQRELAYTTVMTTMARLWEKGVLARTKHGLAYLYTPACTAIEFEENQVRAIVESIREEVLGMVDSIMEKAR